MLLLVLAACTAKDAPVDSGGAPWIELGAGQSGFVPLADGDAVPLVHGLQGGWHVDLALRFGGMGPNGVHLRYEAFDAADDTLLSFATETVLSPSRVLEEGEGWLRLGDRVVFDIEEAAEVLGREVRFEVAATWNPIQVSDARVAVPVE
ncbi:MAG: hypothetical protein H6739_07615 [Alphaproteobacteria bacterium]|nr:hypothetical protein [Alphaproteobacteria bacterium]